MSSQPRTEEQIRTLYTKRWNNLLDDLRASVGTVVAYRDDQDLMALQVATEQKVAETTKNRIYLSALRWCLGGCVNPYHPPECPGRASSCEETE